MKTWFLTCGVLLGAVSLNAQFKSGVDLVALNVVVTDNSQKFVTGLGATNFAVFEDGVRQDISFFAASAVPLDLALLLDTSASMTDKMQTMQSAAIGFASTLRPQDRVAVVDLKDTVRTAYPLGGDFEAALTAIRATTPGGGTALHNALYITLKNLVSQRKGTEDVRRQAIAVLSDGDDTTSLVTFDEVLELAKRSGVTVYTITLTSGAPLPLSGAGGSRYFSQTQFAMKSIAQETGGRSFFPRQVGELQGIYATIADELANQYAIGYTSKNPKRDGIYRRVIVRIAEHPDARTRARSGYFAASLR